LVLVGDLENELARHHRAAFGWARACCRWDRSAADDVLQSAYLKVLDGRARFGGQGEFRAFLFGVIRRTAYEERRQRLLRRTLSLSALRRDRVTAPAPNDLGALVREETSRALIAALRRLSARQREVLHLVFYHDLTITAAAEVLGMSVGSARVHYERGKAQLRKLLDTGSHHAD
jgi:RNA polymerase sigma factor (sigma-70 family)